MRLTILLLAVLILAGCTGAPARQSQTASSPDSTTGLPQPASGLPASEAPVLRSEQDDVVLGITGYHYQNQSFYATETILTTGEPFQTNCRQVELPAGHKFENLTVKMTWASEAPTTDNLRLVVALPKEGKWVWDTRGPSPLSGVVPVGLLLNQSVIDVIAEFPSGSSALAARQQVQMHIEYSWDGAGESKRTLPACGASD